MLAPPRFDVNVSPARISFGGGQSSIEDTSGTEDVNGERFFITFEIEAATIGVNGSSATISFKRRSVQSEVHIYRRSEVSILLNDKTIFNGFVGSQSNTKTRVFLNCIGIEEVIDNFPIIGAKRIAEFNNANKFSKHALSTFNESNQKDRVVQPGSGETVALDVGVGTGTSNEQWTKLQAALYIFEEIIRQDSGRNYGTVVTNNILNLSTTIGEIRRAIAQGQDARNLLDSDFNLKDGLFSFLRQALREAEMTGYFRPDDLNFAMELVVTKLFDSSNEKDIRFDASPINQISEEVIHYDYNVNYDFNSPSQVVVVSGKRFVSTTIVIDPNDTQFQTITDVSDLEFGRLEFEFEASANGSSLVFSSDTPGAGVLYNQKDIFKSGKTGFISNMRNRIKEFDETTGEPVFVDSREILIQFKDESEFADHEGEPILMDGELWQTLKGKNNLAGVPVIGDESLGKLDRLRWFFAQDKLKLTIDGFKPDEFGTVLDNVAFIYIPVTLEIDNRIIGLSERKQNFFGLETEESLYADEDSDSTFDPARRGIETVERNDIRPVSFVQNITDLDSGVIFSDEDFDENTEERLKEIAKAILFDNMRNDGTNLVITVPIELWLNIRDSNQYLTEIGDWINGGIEGTANANPVIGDVGPIIIDRNLTLTQITYSRFAVTLTLT